MKDIKWVATLSDGSTIAENTGKWVEIPGERKPWVRMCDFLAQEGLYLTSLRLNVDGRTIHMPKAKFDRFSMDESSLSPLFYSLAYHAEIEMDAGSGYFGEQDLFIDLAAHYEGYAVHYIQGITNGNLSWVVVTNGTGRIASTPDSRRFKEV